MALFEVDGDATTASTFGPVPESRFSTSPSREVGERTSDGGFSESLWESLFSADIISSSRWSCLACKVLPNMYQYVFACCKLDMSDKVSAPRSTCPDRPSLLV